ncbi:MAG: type II toxin-antitoxin system VapC family toxin [Gammaproteobacteria bacterium]|nr:type II toxin-antitoxin system VapC family toxin [Gammaproteobacteria bacterium]MDP2348199.1 type II toxin-antitoxin system VapC family toxin [Gammaproteobacteria bacterium]
MIGLDTNVLVRYLTQDDAAQAGIANEMIEKELSPQNPGVVTLVCLVEVVWVLESCYDQDKAAIEAVLQGLLTTRQLLVENSEVAWQALKKFSQGSADFSDALIMASAEHLGCNAVMTFDKGARSVGMTLL